MGEKLMRENVSEVKLLEVCMKEIEKLQEENARLSTIAHNAICLWQEENFYSYDSEEEWKEHVVSELDIYEDEYVKIMGEDD
jgi:hypothetical protein